MALLPGQPGNSAIVGRRSTYGGPFHALGTLAAGDRMLVTTTQGQTVYRVSSVKQETITAHAAAPSTLGSGALGSGAPTSTLYAPTANAQLKHSTAVAGAAAASQQVTVDQLYGSTKSDQLTLVTSDQVLPTNTSHGTVVVAKMVSKPFAPTAQNGRTSDQTGLTGDSSSWTGLVLAMQGFALAVVGAVLLNRRFGLRVAYLLTTPPLIVFIILMAESGSHLLPAWT